MAKAVWDHGPDRERRLRQRPDHRPGRPADQYPIRIGDVIEQLSGTYRDLALSIVGRLSRGEQLRGTAQDESRATYSLWRDSEDYQIDWSHSSSKIRRSSTRSVRRIVEHSPP